MKVTINFYLDRNKKLKSDPAIYCYVRSKGRTLAINTGQTISPEHWDKKGQRAIQKGKRKYKYAYDLNSFLNNYKEKIREIERLVLIDKLNANFEDVRQAILDFFKGENKDLWTVYTQFLEVKKLNVSNETITRYKRLEIYLKEFQKKKRFRVEFENIDMRFFDRFRDFLLTDKKLLNNTISNYFTLLKSFMYWATNRGFNEKRTFIQFETKEKESDIIFLTESELQKIFNFDFSNDKKLERVRDCFLFQCLTGVRYSDLETLEYNDIKGSVWHLKTKKTNDYIKIPLNNNALVILEKYKNSNESLTANQLKKQGKYKSTNNPLPVISNQRMNEYIKEVCEAAGINEKVKIDRYRGNQVETEIYSKYEVIGTHTARRTFVSLSLQKGMRPETVMKITGHKTYKMMQKYLGITDQAVNKEMRDVWGEPIRQIK